MTTESRTVVAGKTVRYWAVRKEAIQTANQMTRSFGRQHREHRIEEGAYVVEDVAQKVFYDASGVLPGDVVKELKVLYPHLDRGKV